MRFKIDWASLLWEGNLPFLLCFTLYSRANSKYKLPGGGAYIRRGDLTAGTLGYDFGGAYIWRGLYMERLIFGILRYIEIQRKKKKVVVFCLRPPQNVKLDNLTSWSCSDCKEIYKKVKRTNLLFW